jgi:hypothetical protein
MNRRGGGYHRRMWRRIRIAILSLVLVLVGLRALTDRWGATDWDDTLWIGVFPLNGDGRAATDRYIDTLTPEQFAGIEEFFSREAQAYGVSLEEPVHVELYPRVAELPPRLEPGTSLPGRIWWSLRIRYYSWRIASDTLADIRVFVLYHDPERTHAVPHSLGLQKGLLGIVYAYADTAADPANSVVVAHEVLHTLGATDKYDPATNLPEFPAGFGDPAASPRYPQADAEIMAGRIAVSPDEAAIPASLEEVVVGRESAAEIGWVGR